MTWRRVKVGEASVEVPIDKVVGKARPRFTKAGRTYTPAATKRAERLIADAFAVRYGSTRAAFAGEVHMTLWVTRELAPSNPRYWEGRADMGKPDWDNVGKLVCDALNGLAYADDSQVTVATVVKTPRAAHGEGSGYSLLLEYYEEEHIATD